MAETPRANEPDPTRTPPTETTKMTLQSILIPHDGSALSGAIVESVGPLLVRHGERAVGVTLLHVRDGSSESGAELDAAAKRLADLGAEVTLAERISTDAAGAIVDCARETQPDLVAMSTHGRGGIDRFIRGSVAERVLRACPAPLWMINPHSQSGNVVSSILVPLDDSELAARILDPLIPIARAFGARLTLLFVDWAAASDTPSQAAKRREARERDVREWFAAPLARLESVGLSAEVRIVQGDVAEQILRAAEPGAFDLLAMSTHGRSGARRWLLGSVAEKVLAQCRIPVFVHPARS